MLLDRIELSLNERIVSIVRKHWFVLLSEILGLVFLWVIPIVGIATFPLWRGSLGELPAGVVDARMLTFIGAMWTLALGSAFYHRFTDYYLDVWIITSERIIAINQRGLFKRTIGNLRLDRVQNLDVEIDGIIATMLDFGTLRVESAAHDIDFVVRGIPHPREVKSQILAESELRSATEGTPEARY